MDVASQVGTGAEEAMAWVELLAGDVGSRRPTSSSERLATELVARRLRASGVAAELEAFKGYPSFGLPFGLIIAAAIAPSLLPAGARAARSALALLAGAGLLSEGSLIHTPLSKAISRWNSQNVVATLEPSSPAERTLCLLAHVDTSRSGLIFHPRVVGLLGRWITLNSVLVAAAAVGEPFLGRSRQGRLLLGTARATLGAGLGLLIERELLGQDVPGANDNASGCAVVLSLAARLATEPLQSTRVVLLITGCEESGTLGASAFLRGHDTSGWLFLNFDNVGGDGTLRYLTREGVITHWDADPGMVGVAERVSQGSPGLRMASEDSPAGLTYDASPVLARGGRALTLSIQDGSIPNLHWPTDTVANVDPDGVSRALAAGGELIAAIDRGEAD